MGGTVVRFSSRTGSIDVTVEADNHASRDLLSMLPVELSFEEFAGKEKIAHPPRRIDVTAAEPSSAGPGDLAIYVPWGNLALFYAGERTRVSTDLVHLGTFHATPAELEALEDGPVILTRRV